MKHVRVPAFGVLMSISTKNAITTYPISEWWLHSPNQVNRCDSKRHSTNSTVIYESNKLLACCLRDISSLCLLSDTDFVAFPLINKTNIKEFSWW